MVLTKKQQEKRTLENGAKKYFFKIKFLPIFSTVSFINTN